MPTNLQQQIDRKRKDIKTDGLQMSIGELLNLYRDGDLNLRPEFQRFFRWGLEQKSRWIESVLLGIPLPSIFVEQTKEGKWEVVDGLQRLSTLFEFCGALEEEDGTKKPPLVLQATRYLPDLEGKKWDDKGDASNSFTEDQRRYVKRTKLDIKIVLRESDKSSKYELFQRLNTGGSALTDQELRNCLLISIDRDGYQWLRDLADGKEFQECVSLPQRLISEQYDLELALRFVLLRSIAMDALPGQRTGLGEFLTELMVTAFSEEKLNKAAELATFKAVFSRLYEALGEDAFRKYDGGRKRFSGGFSVAAFEVIALGLGYGGAKRARELGAKELETLIKDEVWGDPNFLTTSGLSASMRLPRTLERGREIFAE